MSNFAPPLVGPSLAQLAMQVPQTFRDAQRNAQRERSLARLAQAGTLDPNSIGLALLEAGDTGGAMAAANLAQAAEDRAWRRSTDERNFGVQQQNTRFQQEMERDRFRLATRTQDRADEPEAVRLARAAGLTPGTPEFQDYVARGGRPTPRLTGSDLNSLSGIGGRLSQAQRFGQTFRDEFGGWRFGAVGNLANVLERNSGVSVAPGSAAWWQEYDRYKNEVRNDLFGSALTATEQAAFERADINPGMTPQAIRANLEIQQRAALGAARRIAQARIQNGDDPQTVAAALGVPLATLGIQPRRAATPAAPAATPAAQPSGQQPAQQQRAALVGQPAPANLEGRRIRNPQTGEEYVIRNGRYEAVTQ